MSYNEKAKENKVNNCYYSAVVLKIEHIFLTVAQEGRGYYDQISTLFGEF